MGAPPPPSPEPGHGELPGASRIPVEVAAKVASGPGVGSFAQAVEAAIANAIDGKATTINVEVDLPRFSFSVEDDGEGIPAETLQAIAEGSVPASNPAAGPVSSVSGCQRATRAAAVAAPCRAPPSGTA